MGVADGAGSGTDVALGTGETQTQVKPEVFTKEQVEKAVRDAKTAVMADVNRFKTEAERAFKAAQAAQARIAEMQKEQEEAELEAAKDEPERLTAIRERQKRRQAESELAQVRAELNEKNTRDAEREQRETEDRKTTMAKEIATRMKVDPATLTKLAKFTDGKTETIEDIAKTLPRLSSAGSGFRPDSNRSEGGGSQTVTDVRRDYASGNINAVQYAERMKALGSQP